MPTPSGYVDPLYREKVMNSGDTTVPGRLYLVDGKPKVCPVGALTVSVMLTALGGGSVVKNYDYQARGGPGVFRDTNKPFLEV